MILAESFLHKSVKYLIAAVAIAAILALNIPRVNDWLKNQFYSLTTPIQKSIWSASADAAGFVKNVATMQSAAQENEKLRRQIVDFEAKLAELDNLKKENQSLHEALSLELDKDYDLKMAQIIGKDVIQDSLLIDKGSSDAVEIGFPVITSNKAVVGRVSKVYPKFSKVTLITGKNISFDVKISDGNIDGLARGQGNSNLIIDLISKEKNINTGMAVFTTSLGGIFPKNLVVGNISNVQKSDVQVFQKADIAPAFNIETSDSVFIVMGVNAISSDSQSDS